jgi:hypothetical protein
VRTFVLGKSRTEVLTTNLVKSVRSEDFCSRKKQD